MLPWLRGIGLSLLIACCLSNVPLLAESETEKTQFVDCHLQLIWKSQSPRKWAGTIAVAAPNDLTPIADTIRQPSNLTRGMLYCGGIHLDSASHELRFAPPPSSSHLLDRDGRLIAATTTEGGVGFHIRAKADDRVVIAIRRDDSDEYTKPVAVPISELLDGRSIQNQFSQDAAWTLRRADGDRLRVELNPIVQDTTVAADAVSSPNLFWDDQQGTLQVSCEAAGNQTLELTCDLYRDHKLVGPKQRWTVTFAGGKATIQSPAWQPPAGDGSYEAVWHLSGNKEQKSVMGLTIPTALGDPMSIIRSSSDTPTLESRSRVVVLSRQPQHPPIELSEQLVAPTSQFTEVGRIEPFGRSWSVGKMIPIKQASQLVGVSTAPELTRHPFSGSTVGEIARGSSWEHALPVGQPGKRHRIKLIMPAASPMKLGIVLQDQVSDHVPAKTLRDYTYSQTRLKTGEEPWKTIALDFYSQTPQVRIRLEDRGGNGPVVFQRIEVQQVDDLPSTAIATSDKKATNTRTAWLQIDGATWLQQFGTPATDLFGNATYSDSFTAAERLIRSMRRNGMNGLAMTVNQDGRALYSTGLFNSDASWHAGSMSGQNSDEQTLPVLLRLLDREQIAFLPCIRMNTPLPALEQAIASASPESIGITPGNLWTGLSLDLSLQQASRFTNLIYNPLHPSVSEACKQAIDELAALLKPHASVRGIGMLVDQGSVWQLPAPQATMDATTLNRFYDALPPNTVARSQLIGWINASGEKAFENWRRAQLHDIFIHAASAMRTDQRQLVVLTSESASPSELAELSRIDNLTLVGLVRRSQIEPLALRCRDEVVSAQMLGMSSAKIAQGNPRHDTAYVFPSSHLAAQRSSSHSPSSRTQPLMDWGNQAFLSTRLLNKADQRNLFLDANLFSVDEPILARSLQEWIALPLGDYEEFNASTEPQKLAKVRTQAIGNDRLLVAISNPSRWTIQAKFTAMGLQSVEPLRSVNKDRILWSPEEVQATLAPGELLAMTWKGSSPSIINCSTRTMRSEEDLLQMSEVIRALAERLPQVTEPNTISVIDNPGFETAPPVATTASPAEPGAVAASTATVANAASASLPGWMVAQYPQGCVCWDHEFVTEGKGSARLRNTDGRPAALGWSAVRLLHQAAVESRSA